MKKKRMFILVSTCMFVFSAFTFQEFLFGIGESRGIVQNRELKEASGLTASLRNPGLLWSHNDSGDEARLFLMDDSAKNKAVVYLAGIRAQDWEEVASFQRNGESYLIIGDMGDNKGKRPFVRVHVVKEPLYRGGDFYRDTIPPTDIITHVLKYEDGPRDAEAMFYDHLDEKLYIISKRELQVGLYETSLPAFYADTLVLRKAALLPLKFVTASSLSTDGQELLIKNLLSVFYWKRSRKESIPTMLRRAGIRLPYQPEFQGEAIAFAGDNSGYYTLSEEPFGFKADLRFYPRLIH